LTRRDASRIFGIMNTTELSSEAIRSHLIERAEAFSKRYGVSLSRIGLDAIKDSKFLSEVKNGRNFTVQSYQNVMDWLDRAEAERSGRAA